jgi:hypothetical protein
MMSGVDIAAIILASGVVAGGAWDRVKRLAGDRRDERLRLANGPEPVCGCGHHLAYHDLHDGRCYAEVKEEKSKNALVWSTTGADADAESDANPGSGSGSGPDKTAVEPVWRRCACRRYAGPEPIATLYAPPIARAGYEQAGPGGPGGPGGPADSAG